MNASRTLVAACGLLGVAGCVVLEPTNPQGVSIDEPVAFRGLTGSPGNEVWVEAAPTRTGAFTTWPAARTTSEAEADYTVPFDRTTISLYPWSVSTIIPEGRWASTSDEGGCLMYETFVRVRDRLGGYQTFDSAQGSTPSGAQCFTDRLESNQPLERAFEGCVSRDNGVIRLEAGTHAVGDFVVDSPAVDPLLSCAHAIEGTLTIIADPGEVIALPRLRRVGALHIRYRTQVLPEFDLRPACGRDVRVDTGQVRLPALTTVDGDVALVQEAAGTPATLFGIAIELGLDALRSIGGDLSLSFAQGGASPCGLTALAAFEGDLDMRLPVGADFAGGRLLTSLVRVGGTVTIEEGYSVIGLLAHPRGGGERCASPHGLRRCFDGLSAPAHACRRRAAERRASGRGSARVGHGGQRHSPVDDAGDAVALRHDAARACDRSAVARRQRAFGSARGEPLRPEPARAAHDPRQQRDRRGDLCVRRRPAGVRLDGNRRPRRAQLPLGSVRVSTSRA